MKAKYTMEYGDFPFYLYDYNSGEKEHTGEQEINSEEELSAVFRVVIPTAIDQKRKCIIVDQFGNCLFLTQDGIILFPTQAHSEIMHKYDVLAFEW